MRKKVQHHTITRGLLLLLLFIFIKSLSAQGLNAIVHYENITYDISSKTDILQTHRVKATIFSEKSPRLKHRVSFDEGISSVKKLEVVIYDMNGDKIDKLKKKDAQEYSAYDGFSVANDSRFLYMDLSHYDLPLTVEFTDVVELKTLAYMTREYLCNYNEKVQDFNLTINKPNDLKLEVYPVNCDSLYLKKDIKSTQLSLSISGIGPYGYESMSPSSYQVIPRIDIVPHDFEFSKYSGNAATSKSFGAFIAELNKDRKSVPDELKKELDALVSGAQNDQEKVHRVYKYLQEKMRYVSIQLGIGGWQSFSCAYVHENKFGDCKALSNYFVSCLGYLGIEAHYCLINSRSKIEYSDDYFQNIFNHIIVHVPGIDEWYECTSKYLPPNYLGYSDYDKEVLAIVDGKGVRKRTPHWDHTKNTRHRDIHIDLNEKGAALIDMELEAYGKPHEIWRALKHSATAHRKNQYISHGLPTQSATLKSYKIQPSTSAPKANVSLQWESIHYGSKSGPRFFIPLLVMDKEFFDFEESSSRHHPIVNDYGFVNTEHLIVSIPDGYEIENIGDSQKLETDYGHIQLDIETTDSTVHMETRVEIEPFRLEADKQDKFLNFLDEAKKTLSPMMVLVKKKT